MQRRHREHQCVLWLVYRVPVGDKIIEQALGWTEGPTHVYQGGMFEAATLQLLQNTVLSNGHSVWAESVGKECYCTVCGLVLDPAWQLREFGRNQAIQKRSVVWVKCNAADTFKNARYVSLRKEPKKKERKKEKKYYSPPLLLRSFIYFCDLQEQRWLLPLNCTSEFYSS